MIHFEHAYARMRFAVGKNCKQAGVVQIAGTVQPNVGFGDVRVVFLVRCEHRVDVVPSLRRFRRCMRACEPSWSSVRLRTLNQFWFVSSETMFSQTTWCVLAPSLAKRGSGAVLFADGGFLGVGVGAGLDAGPSASI